MPQPSRASIYLPMSVDSQCKGFWFSHSWLYHNWKWTVNLRGLEIGRGGRAARGSVKIQMPRWIWISLGTYKLFIWGSNLSGDLIFLFAESGDPCLGSCLNYTLRWSQLLAPAGPPLWTWDAILPDLYQLWLWGLTWNLFLMASSLYHLSPVRSWSPVANIPKERCLSVSLVIWEIQVKMDLGRRYTVIRAWALWPDCMDCISACLILGTVPQFLPRKVWVAVLTPMGLFWTMCF